MHLDNIAHVRSKLLTTDYVRAVLNRAVLRDNQMDVCQITVASAFQPLKLTHKRNGPFKMATKHLHEVRKYTAFLTATDECTIRIVRFTAISALLFASVLGGCAKRSSSTAAGPDYFAKKRECYELVKKQDERDLAKNPDWLFTSPQQRYVPSLNTCICEYVPKKGPSYVIDVLTGKVLVLMERKQGESVDSQVERYQRERDRLFSLCAK